MLPFHTTTVDKVLGIVGLCLQQMRNHCHPYLGATAKFSVDALYPAPTCTHTHAQVSLQSTVHSCVRSAPDWGPVDSSWPRVEGGDICRPESDSTWARTTSSSPSDTNILFNTQYQRIILLLVFIHSSYIDSILLSRIGGHYTLAHFPHQFPSTTTRNCQMCMHSIV